MATIKSIEEKAKAYDEALKYAKIYYTNGDEDMKMMMKTCFPVLVEESEDEKIRKEIISALKYANHKGVYDKHLAWLEKQGEHAKFCDSIQVGDKVTRNKDGVLVNLSQLNRVAKKDEKQGKNNMGISEATKQKLEDNLNKALEKETPESWNKFLDEQGEQKPADKAEPKFKVGDWVVYDGWVCQIIDVTEDGYCNSEHGFIPKGREDSMHLWSIQDAKDGDVLINWNNTAFIFKAIEDETVKFHIAYNEDWDATIKTPSTKLSHLGLSEPQFEFHPATKEQRDLLFQKMHKAGYEWDAEKKELKRIERKHVWSEEDERMLENTIGLIEVLDRETKGAFITKEYINFLKSLKERVLPQPKQEWSEEDEQLYNDLSDTYFYNDEDYPEETYKLMLKRVLDWMTKRAKSLSPQSQWKPSDEQMEAVKRASNGSRAIAGNDYLIMESLYQDLKKL